MSEAVRAINRLAASQWGLLTTAQADAVGVTRLSLSRLAGSGLLERLGQGVYALAGTIDDLSELRAAWLTLEPTMTAEARLTHPVATGVVSHSTAAHLHGLGELTTDVAEFTLPTRRRTRRENVRLHHASLSPDEITVALGLPVTTVERTIADLLNDGQADVQHIADIAGQALFDGKLSFDRLALQLGPYTHTWDQRDGHDAAAWLLDLAGYNATATAAALEASPAGQQVIQRAVEVFLSRLPSTDRLDAIKAFADHFDTSTKTQAKALAEELADLINPEGFAEIRRQAAAFAAIARRDLDA